MKRINMVIMTCKDCPFFREHGPWCDKTGNVLDYEVANIPFWCPLEDAQVNIQGLIDAVEEAYHELRERCGYKPGYHAYDALAEVLKDFQDIKEYFLRE